MQAILRTIFAALGALVLLSGLAAAETWKSGVFSKQEQKISGGWSIAKEADGTYLVLSSDFSTRNAPDLKFFLHPLPAAQVTARNATQGAFVGDLKSPKGASRIKLPASVDPAKFKSVVLHCEQYTKLWGAGDIP